MFRRIHVKEKKIHTLNMDTIVSSDRNTVLSSYIVLNYSIHTHLSPFEANKNGLYSNKNLVCAITGFEPSPK